MFTKSCSLGTHSIVIIHTCMLTACCHFACAQSRHQYSCANWQHFATSLTETRYQYMYACWEHAATLHVISPRHYFRSSIWFTLLTKTTSTFLQFCVVILFTLTGYMRNAYMLCTCNMSMLLIVRCMRIYMWSYDTGNLTAIWFVYSDHVWWLLPKTTPPRSCSGRSW